MKFILAKKLKMDSLFDDQGRIVPVTILEAGPVKITQVKTKDKDGYSSVQVGFGTRRKISKPLQGHLKHLGNLRYLKEFRARDEKKFSRL